MTPFRPFAGRTVLVTGGTRGIGLAAALAFGRLGAQCVLTHAWGSADEADIGAQFAAAGALPPLVQQADAASEPDTRALVGALQARGLAVDVFISNASNALVVGGLEDYTERGFLKSMRATTWPTFGYLRAMHDAWGRYPRHVIVMSSDGPDRYTPGYDFVAAGKAAGETLVRYLAYRLRDDGVRINTLRSRAVRTASFDSTFGEGFHDFLASLVPPAWFVTPEEVAQAAVALASGLLDAVTGETVTVDHGNVFSDGISHVFERHHATTAPAGP
ncbi:MAG: SDR family oxidoreductase [Gemmatimonadaceae bacterium]|nr:SDR family oxidoreductase [Gemmatimonadaceae bacterium]